MYRSVEHFTTAVLLSVLMISCSAPSPDNDNDHAFTPSQVIDLGVLITEDLPQQLWGKEFMEQMGFTRQNSWDVINWTFPVDGDSVSGSNAYYTLFNHGGPHVDAPNHMGVGNGLNSYPIDAFSGPVKVFDVRSYELGRSVPSSVFEGHVDAGDIVLIVTGYTPPQKDGATPEVRTLTNEAAEYLATLPVRAYGTDAFSVESLNDTELPWIHHSFLSQGIPIYEHLFNVEKLVGEEKMYFVGVPLNINEADGMLVRPVVFVY